jgi:AraC family transcriptional regulator
MASRYQNPAACGCSEAVDEAVFVSSLVQIGRFRRAPHHSDFRDSGPIENDCFVFPRTSVEIRHSGERIVADANVAMLYNRGQEYRRSAVSPAGDHCDWFALSHELLRDAVRAHDRRAADSPTRPMRWTHAHVSAPLYLAQREQFVFVSRRRGADAMQIEEGVLALLDAVLSSAYAGAARSRPARGNGGIVSDAKRILGRNLDQPLSLQAIADEVGVSVFHLCRTFRAATGRTLHAYRTALRLLASLDRLEDDRDSLTNLALDAGFSSHSHFTAAFRRTFGAPPSRIRERLGQRSPMTLRPPTARFGGDG